MKTSRKRGGCAMRSAAMFVLTLIVAWVGPLRAQGTTGAEQEVLQAQARRFKAMLGHDLKTLESMFAEELTYGHANGALDTRATYPGFLRTRRYHDISTADTKVHVYGDTAVVTGRLRMVVSNPGEANERRELRLRTTEVYLKRNNRWQFAHFQATTVPSEAGASAQR